MKFDNNDKITCNELLCNQYYMLSSFGYGMLYWECDLYENDMIVEYGIEVDLNDEKYVLYGEESK